MFLPSFSVFLAAVAGGIVTPATDSTPLPPPSASATASSIASGGLPQAPPSGPRATVVAGAGTVDAAQVERVRAAVDAELPSLLPVFDDRPRAPFFVHVHDERASLPDALARSLHPGSPAFAVLGAHQIHIVLGEVRASGARLASVVRHELVHELLDQYVAPNGRHVPRWFHEGLAQHLAGDTYLQASEDDLVLRIHTRQMRSFGELRTHFPTDEIELRTAYAQSYSYVSWLVREHGIGDLLAVARGADQLSPFENVLAGRLGRPTAELEAAWRDYVLHGSGAPWRVLLDQCFTLSLLAILPVLVLALIRRLDADRRAARRLADTDAREAAAEAAAAAALAAQQHWFADPSIDAIPSEEEDAEAERRERAERGAIGAHDERVGAGDGDGDGDVDRYDARDRDRGEPFSR